jgi:Zn-finger nucleic acid-binding protein
MEKVWMGKEPKVLLDSCRRGHGLWFDGGELHQVLCQLEPADLKGSKSVLSFLGNAFQADCKK